MSEITQRLVAVIAEYDREIDALRAENETLRQDAERYRFQRESDWRYRVEHYGASEDERDAYITEYDANYDAAMKEKSNES